MKEKIRQIGSAILLILIVSCIFTLCIWVAPSNTDNFFKIFPIISIIFLIIVGIPWIISKLYRLKNKISEDLPN
jgi:hypothetical protein